MSFLFVGGLGLSPPPSFP